MRGTSEARPGTDRSYQYRLGLSAALLAALTLALVLVVLPRRYVLGTGFQESGVNFPTPGAPFAPGEVVLRPAPVFPVYRVASAAAEATPTGPAERLWNRATPLVEAGRHAAAAELFADYLRSHPDDGDVAREHALLLIRSGRPEAAVDVLRDLAGIRPAPEVRLLVARTLRDLGRPAEADVEYRLVWTEEPDPRLAMEWARSWSWHEGWGEAIGILGEARTRYPTDVGLAVETARTHHWAGAPERAWAILATLPAEALRRHDDGSLRQAVLAAVQAPVEVRVNAEPSLLRQAVSARIGGEAARAARLFREALAADSTDPATWTAWADFLQYEREDYTGARDALLKAGALAGPNAAREFRLVKLESWSGEEEAARRRLETLLGELPAERSADAKSPTRAEALTLLGDLHRWGGDRVGAQRNYRAALRVEPGDSAAVSGLETLDAIARDAIARQEGPRLTTRLAGLADIADYGRLDVGAGAALIRGPWVLRAEAGHRWLEGADFAGDLAALSGGYGGLEVARWWRLGTVRSAVRLGADDVTGLETTLGAEVRVQLADGGVVQLGWDRGPAYMMLGTLQAGLAGYGEDRFRLQASRRIGSVWTAAADLQLSRLHSDLPGMVEPTRTWIAGRVSRSLAGGIVGGAQLRGLSFSEAVPVLGGRRLFWDPESGVSAGPYVEIERQVSSDTRLRGLVFAGAARLDEPNLVAPVWAPQIEVEAGIDHRGESFRGGLDLFYLQGQFSDYRSWGLRVRFTPWPGRRDGGTP